MSTSNQKLHHLLLFLSTAAMLAGNFFATTVTAAEADFSGKRIVPLLQEPRHRTVYHDGDIYLLDLQINAGDISLPHVHDSAILVTTIANGAGPVNGRVSANTDYVTKAHTHEVGNDGPGMLRIIAMPHFGPGEDDVMADRPQGFNDEPTLENKWFRSYRVKLAPGEETSTLLFDNPSVVVQVTDGKVHVSRTDGITAELDEMAKWAWRDAHTNYRVRNVGNIPVELVVNEARR